MKTIPTFPKGKNEISFIQLIINLNHAFYSPIGVRALVYYGKT